ncbi:glycosyltransferase family 4 protein [Desulfobacter curvatus]|uniref:glycosyltransferase family 4 protein n=1 Tax=Desulfobacter curvatus TaxID=2290 RepID=UPI0003801CF8|nr:glycosyltransferase [Desulfobacter curvatus]
MKVLWFSNTPANSDEYFSRELKGTGGWLKALDQSMQNNVELHIAFYHDQDIQEFQYKKTHYHPIFKEKKGLLSKYLDMRFSKVVFREDVGKYLDIIDRVRPDLIHVHGTENPFGYIQEYVDFPVCISIQGNITVCFHRFFSGLERRYLKYSSKIIKTISGIQEFKIAYNKFSKMQIREQEILQKCKYIFGRTEWDYQITRILAPKSEYFYVGEVLREGFYSKSWEYNADRRFVVFTTSGNTFYKGFESLCFALELLIDSNNLDLEWRVAGVSENDGIVQAVKKKLGSHYPKKGLRLLGRLNEDELIDQLLDASIYVMPSHIENSPNNLCEAMILGMPCIATYVGGTGSLLEHGKEGLLIQDGDPWALAGAVLELLRNPGNSVKMGAFAKKKAIARHNKTKIINDLQKVYSEILSKKRK